MEKDRGAKVIGVIALVVAVIGMSVGFAAFSRTLTIEPQAAINPAKEGDLNITFDYFSDSSISTSTDGEGASIVSSGTIDNMHTNGSAVNPLVSDLKAKFTAKGQSATFKFKVVNNGPYEAYRTGVSFVGSNSCTCYSESDTEREGNKCTLSERTIVENACNDITMEIKFRADDEDIYSPSTGNNTSINGKSLAANSSEIIEVKVTYNGTNTIPITDFDVTLPIISLVYSSLDNTES